MNTKPNTGKTGENTVVELLVPNTAEAQAYQWLAKLDADETSAEDMAAFKQWINQSEQHRVEFENILTFWNELNVLTQVITPREKARQLAAAKKEPLSNWSRFRHRYTIGGMVLASLLVVFIILAPWQAPVLYSTAIGEQRTVTLPDNTKVLLNTNSEIEVQYQEQRRGINLKRGEAYFEVFHNPDRPFEVYVDDKLVRAVGTAFAVHIRDKDVEVVVTEGAVEIGSTARMGRQNQVDSALVPGYKTQPAMVITEAGNQAVFDRIAANNGESEVRLEPVEQIEQKLSWQQGMLIFEHEPLANVVEEVSRYTPLKIVILERKVRELEIGGIFKIGNTESLFEALRDGFGIHVKYAGEDLVYLVSDENR